MSRVRQLLAGVLLLSQAVAALGAEYLVSTAKEFAKTQRMARPGDAIVLRDGAWMDAELLFDAQGEPGKPITLRAQTSGKVVLSGKSRLRLGGEHLVVEGLWFKDASARQHDVIDFRATSVKPALNCRVTGCAITSFNPPDKKQDYKWISMYGVSNRVDHCYFAGKKHAGTTMVVWVDGQPNYHQIDHNHFGPRPRLGENGGETIRVGTSEVSMGNSRTAVEFNLFQECNGEVEIVSNKSCENVYRHNTFLNCEGAMTLRHGNRCVVEANYFIGNHRKNTGGVRVIGEDHRVVNNLFSELAGVDSRSALTLMNGLKDSPLHGYFQVKRAVIAFNTFTNCKSSVLIGYVSDNPKGGDLPPLDCVFAGNLLEAEYGVFFKEETAPVNWKWQGNLAVGSLGIPVPKGISQRNYRTKDWRRADADRGEFVLFQATGFPEITEDIEGQPRGEKKDMGCDQISDAPAKYKVLTKETTGPEWLKER
jgi:poly(beta-D-mannuronate) lyase